MHRTLKNDVLDPIARNLKEQQKAFDIFRHDFNHNRPHESLNDQTPNEFYAKSNRPYVEHPHMPEYDYDYTVRHIRDGGDIKFKGRMWDCCKTPFFVILSEAKNLFSVEILRPSDSE